MCTVLLMKLNYSSRQSRSSRSKFNARNSSNAHYNFPCPNASASTRKLTPSMILIAISFQYYFYWAKTYYKYFVPHCTAFISHPCTRIETLLASLIDNIVMTQIIFRLLLRKIFVLPCTLLFSRGNYIRSRKSEKPSFFDACIYNRDDIRHF